MANIPFPVNSESTEELKTQLFELIRQLYEDKIGGLELGDVFADEGDYLSLQLNSLGGLEKSSGEVGILLRDEGGLNLGSTGLGVKLKPIGGLEVDALGVYSTEVAAAHVYADASEVSATNSAASAVTAAAQASAAAVSAAAALVSENEAEAAETNINNIFNSMISYYLKAPTAELTSITTSDWGAITDAHVFVLEKYAEYRYDLVQGSATLDLGSIT
jgi:hypothetical protein